MPSLSATIRSNAAEADPKVGVVVADGWYPPIDMVEMRKSLRLGDVVTTERLRDAIVAGMISARNDLRAWKAAQLDAGHLDLAAVPADRINGVSVLAHAWRAAVYGYAAADLAETHRDISATNDGVERADERLPTAVDYRRNALQAVRDIQGKRRTRAKLV